MQSIFGMSLFGMSLKWSSRAPTPSGTEAQPAGDDTALLLDAPAAGKEAEVRWDPFADLSLDRAISLRWTLRDILARRTKFLPVAEDDLQLLVDMGLVELRDGEPALTSAGATAME